MKSVAMITAILCLAGLAAADRNLQSVTTSSQTSQVSICKRNKRLMGRLQRLQPAVHTDCF